MPGERAGRESRRATSSATMRPRLKTRARWQIWATSSKSDEIDDDGDAGLERLASAAGRSPPWRRRRRRWSGPRAIRSLRPRWPASGRPRPSAGCRPTGCRWPLRIVRPHVEAAAEIGRLAALAPPAELENASRRSQPGSGTGSPAPTAPARRLPPPRLRGDEADAAGDRLGAASEVAIGVAVEARSRPLARKRAEERAADGLLAGAAQADQAEILAVARVEVEPARRLRRAGPRPPEAASPAAARRCDVASSVERPTIIAGRAARAGLADRRRRRPCGRRAAR